MARRRQDNLTFRLFDWTPAKVAVKFKPEQVRALTLDGQIARAVAQTLSDSELSREEIAKRMSDFLGVIVSKGMLDSYASQAKEDHRISAARLAALAHATDDVRPIAVLAGQFGYEIIPERYMGAIVEAMAIDHQNEVDDLIKSNNAKWKGRR